jgi:dipeptidyl-peptidase-4
MSQPTLAALLFVALSACASAPSPAPASPHGTEVSLPKMTARPLTFERITADPPLEGRAPTALALSPDGAFLTWLQPNADDSEVLDLWGMRLPSGKAEALVATADLLAGATQKLTDSERMALERKRITKRGITAYEWCGKEAHALVFPLSGDLYLARLADGAGARPAVTRLTTDDDAPEINPTCSPDGKQIAFVKGQDVVALDLATNKTTPVTRGGGGTRSFGLAEFVAEEEMLRHEGFWWSPNGDRLLIFEVDESTVGVKRRAQIHADHTAIIDQRYPAAGEANAKVTAWIYPLTKGKAGKRIAVATPREDGYLPRAGFFADGTAWVQWQSRDQKTLLLLEVGADGKTREILRETDAAWVELHDDLAALEGQRSFLWSTERSGRRQLVKVDRDTLVVSELTAEPEPVSALLAVDHKAGHIAGTVFYSAFRARGKELHVFSIPLAGGPATRLTPEPGWHAATFSRSGRFFIDRRSDVLVPNKTTLRDATGTIQHVIDDNPATELATYDLPKPQWVDVTAADGAVMNAVLFEPAMREPGVRYPVITFVYGGPAAQTVRRAWQKSWLAITAWTHRGYGVFLLDNRGMAGRDRDFARGHHNRFGEVEMEDQRRGYEALTAIDWVDAKRVGIFGWSYGGYLSARAVLDDASPFAAAAAVAPVTDWTLYDTHYTERYLGLPSRDATGALTPGSTYARADLVSRATSLDRPLLLVHGTADDNVLFDNTLKLAEALQTVGKPFDLMIYPGKAHGIAGRAAQRHVWETITAFFDEHLRRGPSASP